MAEATEQAIGVGRSHIIERPRLTRLLDETTARVIMLVAPAGYGKTTLARQWLTGKQHAWYQGSTASADVAALALGIVEAASVVLPGIGRRLREWLPLSSDPEKEVDVIAELLAEDLEPWPDEAWFAIDDYHTLSSEASDLVVQKLFGETGRRLLITSRSRPTWAAARDLLYGNMFELGQSTLAMTLDEASTVLSGPHAETASGLVALANGWPAVIGLAAITPSPISGSELPGTLQEYFAEEVFAALDEEGQAGLCQLALLPAFDRRTAEALVGPATAQRVLSSAEEAGILADSRSAVLTFHPLLRSFSNLKFVELDDSERVETVTRAVKVLSDAGKWDDAFALLHKHERPDLIQLLLKRGMLSILEHGRLVTLRDWLRFVGGRHAVTPYVLLAQAELAFRSGSYERAGRLAYRAATELDATDPLKSTAYYRAGQSCSLMDRAAEALELFVSARKNAHSHRDSRNALWGEFSVLVELEQPTAEERLNELENTAPNDPDTSVRWASGLVVLGVRTGGVENAVDRASDVLSMLDDVRDPSVRSSFWHVFAAALVLNARYEEALEAVTSALQEVEAFQIHFALPYILFNRATACIGLRRFDEAEQTIGEVARHARENLDGHILANAGMLHGRLLLQTGSADAAAVATSTPIAHPISKSMKAEYLLTHALALACSGKPKAAARMVESVRSLSGYLEPQLLASWATALCALHLDDPAAGDQIRLAYEQSVNSGAFDLVVFAYRLDPVVLPILAADKINRSLLAQIVVAAQDHSLARAADLELPPPPAGGVADLTARESQVYRLLGEGLTNREIAETLVISEPTAKVHVSNVLQKLGVRSRTQAAIIAARTGFPGGEKA